MNNTVSTQDILDRLPIKQYGVKGQKWGVIRTPTQLARAAGRRLSGKTNTTTTPKSTNSTTPTTTTTPKSTNSTTPTTKSKQSTQTELDDQTKPNTNSGNSNSKKDLISKPITEMTDNELRTLLTRLDMEKRYSDITTAKVKSGMQKLESATKTLETLAKTSTSALTLYQNYNKLNDIVKGSSKKAS